MEEIYVQQRPGNYVIVELVGGPLDGHAEPFFFMPAEQLIKKIEEELEGDPLRDTEFGNPPEFLEATAVVCEHPLDPARKILYAFSAPWRTASRRRLRAEYVPFEPGRDAEGDLVVI